MAKLQLKAAPTFQAKVGIPVAGAEPVDVLMTFKHRTKPELDAFVKSVNGMKEVDKFMAMVVAWDLEDELNAENVKTLTENYMGATLSTYSVYLSELVKARLGN